MFLQKTLAEPFFATCYLSIFGEPFLEGQWVLIENSCCLLCVNAGEGWYVIKITLKLFQVVSRSAQRQIVAIANFSLPIILLPSAMFLLLPSFNSSQFLNSGSSSTGGVLAQDSDSSTEPLFRLACSAHIMVELIDAGRGTGKSWCRPRHICPKQSA